MAVPATIQSPTDIGGAEYGDFVDSEDDLDVTEYTEWPYEYKFYPIRIGEVINQTYQIDHKLGHGGFSTVWMAHDLKRRRDVALKITARNSGEYEYKMLEEIKCTVKDTSHLVTSIASFILRGKDSDHRVLVFPLRGPSLNSLYGLKGITMATRMSAARQLLEGLANLHEAGLVHRGK